VVDADEVGSGGESPSGRERRKKEARESEGRKGVLLCLPVSRAKWSGATEWTRDVSRLGHQSC
jgi:hypothetical protein